MSSSRFNTFEITPFNVGRGRGLCSTPVPFPLGDFKVGGRKTFDGDSVHSPIRSGDVMTPSIQPTVELSTPVL